MAERKVVCGLPQDVMGMQDASLLFVTPDYRDLDSQASSRFVESLIRSFDNKEPFACFPVCLSLSQARQLWIDAASGFDWEEELYEGMSSGTGVVILMRGQATAMGCRGAVRSDMASDISRISEPLGHRKDLVHSPDIGSGEVELRVFSDARVGNQLVETPHFPHCLDKCMNGASR
jgi:hypothetical protein